MKSGRPAAICRRIPSASQVRSSAATTAAASTLPLGGWFRRIAQDRRTPGIFFSSASTSPSSIRNPRIFTWSSDRPTNASLPSACQKTWSPVR